MKWRISRMHLLQVVRLTSCKGLICRRSELNLSRLRASDPAAWPLMGFPFCNLPIEATHPKPFRDSPVARCGLGVPNSSSSAVPKETRFLGTRARLRFPPVRLTETQVHILLAIGLGCGVSPFPALLIHGGAPSPVVYVV